ncbi:uncharacterized protein ISCGN_031744 [Ixodes scapularis]
MTRYDHTMHHVPDRDLVVADALSPQPLQGQDSSHLAEEVADFEQALIRHVMTKLPQTFMIQSLGNYPNLICGYQHFYNETRRACDLMVTKEHFSKPLTRCREKFQQHCKGPAFNYAITNCPYPKDLN